MKEILAIADSPFTLMKDYGYYDFFTLYILGIIPKEEAMICEVLLNNIDKILPSMELEKYCNSYNMTVEDCRTIRNTKLEELLVKLKVIREKIINYHLLVKEIYDINT